MSLVLGVYLLGDDIRQHRAVNDSLKLLEGGVANLSDNLRDVTIRAGIEWLGSFFYRLAIYCLVLILIVSALIGNEWTDVLGPIIRPVLLATGYTMIVAVLLWSAVKIMYDWRIENRRFIFFFGCITGGAFFLLFFGDPVAQEVFWSAIDPSLPSTKKFLGVDLFGVAWGRAGVAAAIIAVFLLMFYLFYWVFNSFLIFMVVVMVAIPVFIARFVSEFFPARETRLKGLAVLLWICSMVGVFVLS